MEEWLGQQPPPLGTPINESHPLRKGLVGHWKLDEQTLIHGSRVEDISLFKNHGTLSTGDGAIDKSNYGKLNRACNFDGVNDSINCGDNDSLIFIGNVDYTISGWIKMITWKSDSALAGIWNSRGYMLYFVGLNVVRLYSDASFISYIINPSALLNSWHFFVGTKSGNIGALYIDGILIGNGVFTDPIISDPRILNPNIYFEIASYNQNGGLNVNGLIDDVRIFNRALPKWEIEYYLYFNPFAYHIKSRYWSLVVGTRYDEIFNDGFAITDSHIKSVSKTLADSISLSDTVVKQVDVAKDDGFTISDSLVKDIAIVLSDTIVFSDSIKRDLSVAFDDSVTFTDEIIGGIEILLNLADGIVFTDSFQKSVAIVKDDTINLSDDTSKVISVNLSDVIRLIDARVTQIDKVFSDQINIDESQSQIRMKLKDMPHAVIDVNAPSIHLIVRNP